MHEAFSFNREYDYVRLDGLSRATGRPAHEWDIYIVKELIDNALDADELLWQLDSRLLPSVHILMEYISAPLPQNEQNQQLFIRVLNRAMFPVKQIEAIFSTQWYTSQKAFIKGFSRGALGNASKTLLGIPYALHNYISEDWTPHLKPLSICCGGIEYLPSYIIDATTQSIHFYCAEHACKPFSGTLISIGLDYFEQEKPRNLVEIEILAEHYHLCNPHTTFCWTVEIKEQVWQKEYTARSDWTNKFRGYAPIQYGGPLCQDTKIGIDKSYFPPFHSCILNALAHALWKYTSAGVW